MKFLNYTSNDAEDLKELFGYKSVPYGDFKPTWKNEEGLFFELAAYSDYSGDIVDRANCNEFLKKFGGLDGVFKTWGGHGTCGVVVSYELYKTNEEIKEVVDGLEDYPLISDESLSALEIEIQDESWGNWIKYDLKRALDKAGIEGFEDEDKMKSKFYHVIRYCNIEYTHEDAVSCHINIKEVVENWAAGLCPSCKQELLYEGCKCENCQTLL